MLSLRAFLAGRKAGDTDHERVDASQGRKLQNFFRRLGIRRGVDRRDRQNDAGLVIEVRHPGALHADIETEEFHRPILPLRSVHWMFFLYEGCSLRFPWNAETVSANTGEKDLLPLKFTTQWYGTSMPQETSSRDHRIISLKDDQEEVASSEYEKNLHDRTSQIFIDLRQDQRKAAVEWLAKFLDLLEGQTATDQWTHVPWFPTIYAVVDKDTAKDLSDLERLATRDTFRIIPGAVDVTVVEAKDQYHDELVRKALAAQAKNKRVAKPPMTPEELKAQGFRPIDEGMTPEQKAEWDLIMKNLEDPQDIFCEG